MLAQTNYSINYTPSSSSLVGRNCGGINNDNNIVIPGGQSSRTTTPPSSLSAKKQDDNDDDGVVITPDPSSIVIKTRLMKKNQGPSGHFDNGNDNMNESYVPPSLSSIYSAAITTFGEDNNNDNNNGNNNETKVFLNICTHPLIATPGKRKGLDEQTGTEVDGWRLPMSMGELRPCYDKGGNAAIVADCILNPAIVREMNGDSNYLHFVCDVVIQCACRKFGCEFDRRFKLPKMKYAGYVDETTNLPILPESLMMVNGAMSAGTTDGSQKAVVAKQRVKGHGGNKSLIIEEVESISDRHPKPTNVESLDNKEESREELSKAEFHIELFIGNGNKKSYLPLFNFLRLSANEDTDIVPHGQPSTTLREMIKSPKLKPCDDENEKRRMMVHESQMLSAPLPFDIKRLLHSLSQLSCSFDVTENSNSTSSEWRITAKCSIISSSNTPTSINLLEATPTVDLSAFLLVVSTNNGVKTECILPFPVDTHKTSTTYNPTTGLLEIQMPLLENALNIDDGPDPGTKQWELRHALGGDNSIGSKSGSAAHVDDKKGDTGKNESGSSETTKDVFSSYFLDANSNTNNNDDGGDIDNDDTEGPLPEDAFHSQDVLSRHLLQQQEEERKARSSSSNTTNSHGRDGADIEYINVDDFRPTKNESAREECKSSTLKMAQKVMKDNLQDRGTIVGSGSSDLVFGLV